MKSTRRMLLNIADSIIRRAANRTYDVGVIANTVRQQAAIVEAEHRDRTQRIRNRRANRRKPTLN